MLFNSYVFVLFFGIVLTVYWRLGRSLQNRFLLAASYLFYGWWDWRFLGLIALSTVVDYFCGLRVGKGKPRRKAWLLFSLCTNLGILGFFKYFGFFVDSAERFLGALGVSASTPILEFVLPVGISFYTFQTLSYTIDAYRGHGKPERNFWDFALYVSYFPQLVAGPIERSTRLLPQLRSRRTITREMVRTASVLILMGFFKKIAIADAVAPYVDSAFMDPGGKSAPFLWISLYLFTIQIYCDFSGYSDIARGVSRLLGIELMVNFRQPYLATNIVDFWRRWHISLSSWLRDYLYIPLGGNRSGKLMTYRNLFLTMLLGGLWHGAGWNFVIWGGLHGLYLAIHRFVVGKRPEASPGATGLLRKVPAWFLTFHLVCLAWVFFRADTFPSAQAYIQGLFIGGLNLDYGFRLPICLFYGLAVLAVDWGCWKGRRELPFAAESPAWLRAAGYATMFLILSFVGEPHGGAFIYFQF